MQIHIYHHHEPAPSLLRLLTRLNSNMEKIMSTLDLLLDDVRAQKTQIDSLSALIANIKNQLRDALSGEKLSPAAEAKLAAIMPELEANTAEITAAINANTDAAPAPAPDPFPSGSELPTDPIPNAPPNPISFGTPPSSSPKEA